MRMTMLLTPFLETLANRWVFNRVNLHSTFDQIQWDNDGVGKTTRKGTTNATFDIIFSGAEFNLLLKSSKKVS